MKTVPHKPGTKRKAIIMHWSFLVVPLLGGFLADTINHLLGVY